MNKKETEKYFKSASAVKVISSKDWILLFAILALFFATIFWLFFGTYKNTLTISNAMFVADGYAVEIHEPYIGKITEWYANIEGKPIKKGDVIGRVYKTSDNNADNRDIEYMKNNAVDIVSDVSGFVSDICVSEWQNVDVSTVLMTVCESSSEKIKNVLATVDMENLSVLKKGMPVTIGYGENFSKEYGYLTGKISDIGNVNLGYNDLYKKIGHEEYTLKFMGNKFENYPIYVEIDTDENGDLIWHSGKRGPLKFNISERCFVTFIINEVRPIDVMLDTKQKR